jgi:hypothetical protein
LYYENHIHTNKILLKEVLLLYTVKKEANLTLPNHQLILKGKYAMSEVCPGGVHANAVVTQWLKELAP